MTYRDIKELKEIAKTNNIKYGTQITKRPLYNLLLKNKVIPLK